MIYEPNDKAGAAKLQQMYEDLTDQYREAWCKHLEEDCAMIDIQLRIIRDKLKELDKNYER